MLCPPNRPCESRPDFFTCCARYCRGSSCDARCGGTGGSSNSTRGARGDCSIAGLRESSGASEPVQIRNSIVLPQIEDFNSEPFL